MKRINQLIAVVATMLLWTVTAYSQSYFQFGNLNQDSVNVTSAWTKLKTTTGTHTFTKANANTKLEVHVNSRFGIGLLSGGANGVRFQVRIDSNTPNFDNMGSIRTSNTAEFLSIFAVFENIPAGSHTVSIWAQVLHSGSASSVVVDPGGWGGKIIVKETP